METGASATWVSVRTRLAVLNTRWKTDSSALPQVSASFAKKVRLLDLAQNLGLAHDQGIQTRGHAEQVAHRFLLAMDVEAVGEFIKANAVKRLGKPAESRHAILLLKSDKNELHAIAGGDDDGLFDLRFALKPAQDLRDDSAHSAQTAHEIQGALFCD